MNYINVILPIPLERLFTYRITQAESGFLKLGMRVAVPFGKSKIYTALVYKIHQTPPVGYDAKDIYQILDDKPIVNEKQLKHWSWLTDYYLCALGDVLRAGLPSIFLLESETLIIRNEIFEDESILDDDEYLIYEALQRQSILKVQEVSAILDKKKVLPIINQLMIKGVLSVKEEIFEQYKPKLVKYVKLNDRYISNEKLSTLLVELSKAKKQKQAVMHYFSLNASTKKPIKAKTLQEVAKVSASILKALVDKSIFEIYYIQTDRINYEKTNGKLKELTDFQETAYQEIKNSFKEKEVTLLHGITSSGKTEIYTKLIKDTLHLNKQVLYLLPEIALTTQLIERLKIYFGDQISVFHSKYSLQERVEVWRNLLYNKKKTQIILGARSSIFLPFNNLGLIIVDEEHETSYKQFEPAPRYHARDAAIVLANLHQAKVLLGSATPSIESFYNAQKNKYALVTLNRRFSNIQLPEVELVNLKEKYRKKQMNGHFSDRMLELMQRALDEKEQIIIFQNRRGFSPIVTCNTCGVSAQCPNCDVSLTYHKFRSELRCHYCNYSRSMPKKCLACGGVSLSTKGFGTEQIELEIQELFKDAKVARMDLDTTRGKYGYHKIISAFQSQEVDILVGTQMLSKGLDFANVSLVGILNADNMLNFPDFRAHERSFQLMVQVSGRAGRAKKRGKVAIQTYNPFHQILQQVTTTDYINMYKEQLEERYQYKYPPLLRTIKITLKHKDFNKVNRGSEWLAKSLNNQFLNNVLGPTSPVVARVRNQYIKFILIKLPVKTSIKQSKIVLKKIKINFQSIAEFRPIRFIFDVDNM
ncbi:MAG: primosomal protein N' [Flavobacteriaceae bacterium]|nr:primosomal protein N' [Flavobacteriaceae bacterium]